MGSLKVLTSYFFNEMEGQKRGKKEGEKVLMGMPE